nr:sugar phosphate nucleotidyltransferase [Paludibacteraceae bacterium]
MAQEKQCMIFAAGLGTRLKPLTDTMPKALVPVNGKPLLEYVLRKLKAAGFTKAVINVYHFAEQIIDFVNQNDFGMEVSISDEREMLLDTGGGVKKAQTLLNTDQPFL